MLRRGPDHLFPASRESAAIAPQIGPKEAPTIEKNVIRCSAAPVMASSTPIVTPIKVETLRGTFGIMVAKLFEAIKVQKHVGATEAAAKRKNMTGPGCPQRKSQLHT